MKACLQVAALALSVFWTLAAGAEDAFYRVPVRDLKLVEGSLPERKADWNWRAWSRASLMQPYATLDGEGEAYVRAASGDFRPSSAPGENEGALHVRAAAGQDLSGRLYWPNGDWTGMVALKFTISATAAKAGAREDFYRGKQAHYEALLARNVPGSAWFRHQVREARAALGQGAALPAANQNNVAGTDNLSDTYALFTGGRAMSENLQLDRVLWPVEGKQEMVEIDSITGITVREIDWTALTKDLKPALDPLAAKIPADQHALFFPTFNDALKVADDFVANGATILGLADPRSENARTVERYERQLGLPLSGLGRMLGPKLARSIAVTGSDPYFRTGTDVAVVFEAASPALLETAILAQLETGRAANGNAKPENVHGEVEGLSYSGLVSADRSVCSYVASFDGAVVVTNSLHQLRQLANVQNGKTPSLGSLPEFAFFRDRYRLGDQQETALLFLSDATIRRWCGPKWRIATSRRTRDAAIMAELQASFLPRLVRKEVQPGPLHTELPVSSGELTLSASGVRSSAMGSLDFLTPIAELDLKKVTLAESQAYERWRDTYQSNWRWAFDPIALRLGFQQDRVSADLSVMPLIWNSEYRQFISIAQGVDIAADAGDRHGALVHAILGINHESDLFRMGSNFASMMAPQIKVDPLGWLGDWVALYVDDDPVWAEMAKVPADKRDKEMEKFLPRLPVALHADVSSAFKLAAFLTGLRAFIQQTAPDLTTWESLTYNDKSYVRITAAERNRDEDDPVFKIYYAASAEGLIVTLNEDLLKRALDRQAARAVEKDEGAGSGPETAATGQGQPWLGDSLGLQVDRKMLEIAASLGDEQYQQAMQARAWGNLAILSEWKRRFPDQDPVELHKKFWQVELVCPGGGEYAWNAEWQTMQSTVYGHPGEPKLGPPAPPQLAVFRGANFGVTLEEQSLRARVELQRDAAPPSEKPSAESARR